MRYLFSIFIVFFASTSFAANKTNPDIGLNTLFTYTSSTEGNSGGGETTNGFAFQEAELSISSNIDTNFRGSAIFAFENEGGEFHFVPEEVFVETLSIDSVTFRLGKFYPFFGRSNQWHTHAFPFIDANQTREQIFGEEGFNEVGLSVSYLAPTPWYLELVAQVFNGDNERAFASGVNDDVVGVYYLKSLWDLNGDSTLEWNLSYAHGRTQLNEQNDVYNTALTYINKFSNSQKLILTSEYTQAQYVLIANEDVPGTFDSTFRTGVSSTWVQFQFLKEWWAQARYEVVSNILNVSAEDTTKTSGLIAYVPSEFSAIRLQYDSIEDPAADEVEQRVILQLNLTTGYHPSHSY